VVSGLGGEPEYRDRFYEWSIELRDAAKSRFGLADEQIWYLAEKPDRDPERIRAKSTKEEVEKAFHELAEKVAPGDQLFVVLVGHGSYRSGESRFNLPGPDMTDADFARALEPFRSQQIVFVNTASASGGFIPVLSGENRIVVTATKTGNERNETLFGKYFIEAFADEGADVDKDRQVSVLGAFEYARLHVARIYQEGNQLQTEHALLDDDGDRKGAQEPGGSSDGSRAKFAFLLGGPGATEELAEASEDPELAALYRENRVPEERSESLKRQKDGMPSGLYLEELERLLVELAQNNRGIQALADKRE
jgi:hypothetical protein